MKTTNTLVDTSKLASSLDNFHPTSYNFSALNIKRYYRSQVPPGEKEKNWKDPLFPPNNNSVFGRKENGDYIDISKKRINGYMNDFNVKRKGYYMVKGKGYL